jgi:hypothetical protein
MYFHFVKVDQTTTCCWRTADLGAMEAITSGLREPKGSAGKKISSHGCYMEDFLVLDT